MIADILLITNANNKKAHMIPIQFKLTSAQFEAFEKLRGDESKAAFLRRLLAQEANQRGIVFPEDTPSNDISKAQAKRWAKGDE